MPLRSLQPTCAAVTRAPAGGPARPLRPAMLDASAPAAARRPTRPGQGRSAAPRRVGQTDRRTRLQAYHALLREPVNSTLTCPCRRRLANFQAEYPRAYAA